MKDYIVTVSKTEFGNTLSSMSFRVSALSADLAEGLVRDFANTGDEGCWWLDFSVVEADE